MKLLRPICAFAFLIVASDAFAFCVPGEVGTCYVNGRLGHRVCGPNGIYGPCQAGAGTADAATAPEADAPSLNLAAQPQRPWLWQSARKLPRCPPASAPIAMTASQPCSARWRASATVVAEAITAAPAARTRATSGGDGSPKWKLTTRGRHSSTIAHIASSNGRRVAAGSGASGAMPCSA